MEITFKYQAFLEMMNRYYPEIASDDTTLNAFTFYMAITENVKIDEKDIEWAKNLL